MLRETPYRRAPPMPGIELNYNFGLNCTVCVPVVKKKVGYFTKTSSVTKKGRAEARPLFQMLAGNGQAKAPAPLILP
jgi:hypothetical protein